MHFYFKNTTQVESMWWPSMNHRWSLSYCSLIDWSLELNSACIMYCTNVKICYFLSYNTFMLQKLFRLANRYLSHRYFSQELLVCRNEDTTCGLYLSIWLLPYLILILLPQKPQIRKEIMETEASRNRGRAGSSLWMFFASFLFCFVFLDIVPISPRLKWVMSCLRWLSVQAGGGFERLFWFFFLSLCVREVTA